MCSCKKMFNIMAYCGYKNKKQYYQMKIKKNKMLKQSKFPQSRYIYFALENVLQ